MHALNIAILLLFVISLTAGITPAQAKYKFDLGREVLPENDGWASLGTGTTGGAAATSDHIYTVHNRRELIAALNDGVYPPTSSTPSSTPKIIYVVGTIDANIDDNNQPLTCQDYYRDGYTLEAFLAAYDPAVWGRIPPSGELETARLASQTAQTGRVRIKVGSNTTIVGVGVDATIQGAWLDLRGTASGNLTNIIIRNITFQDTYDCFPAWEPTDGLLGAWNALYDTISLRYTDHVWIDHNTFEDRDTADSGEPTYFGVHYERHDGEVDITNVSDLVTVSWNRFLNHDKVLLIGSSDVAETDRGYLRVTLHHNLFDGTGQRTPRVRFGQVHVYNNYYRIINNPVYSYAWGVGIESEIYAENNYITTNQKIGPGDLISVFGGTMIYETGTCMKGTSGGKFVDVVADYNALYDPDLDPLVNWTPTLFTYVDPTQWVVPLVANGAGPFNW